MSSLLFLVTPLLKTEVVLAVVVVVVGCDCVVAGFISSVDIDEAPRFMVDFDAIRGVCRL